MTESNLNTPPPRLALVNGRVYTQDRARPIVQAIASIGDRIVAAGSSEEALAAAGPGAKVVDLGGRAVVPGFIDAHFHFLGYSFDRQRVQLDQAASITEVQQLVRPLTEAGGADAWILGRGWDRNLWPGAPFPIRHDLDVVTGGRPAALLSRDVHAVWANTRALELAGITRETPDPPGGKIVRERDGSPSGVLLESAAERVRALADRPSPAREVEAALAAQTALLSVGVTGLCNFEGVEALRALQTIEASGQLQLRVAAGVTRGGLAAASASGLRTGFGGDRLRIGLLKLFADGALGSGTAAMLAPFDDGGPDDTGIPTITHDELLGLIREARAAGIGVATHAIGDAAVRLVLDAAETARADDHPDARRQILRVEHAQLVAPADLARFQQLDVIASMQPIHATSDMYLADRRWGTRCQTAYAWRALLDTGARVAFGTDCPVEPPDPLKSIHAAVTRQRPDDLPPGGWYPEQRVTVAEAIYAYTAGSADALGWGGQLGMLRPGALADAVILAADPYTTDPSTLHQIAVALTVFDGRIAYQPSAHSPLRGHLPTLSNLSGQRSLTMPPSSGNQNGHGADQSDATDRPWSFDTLVAHAGESHTTDSDGSGWRPTAGAIHNASGFFMPSLDALDEVFAGQREGYFYTRDGNPTVRAFEEAVAALESAPTVGAFGSGMAAIYGALLAAEIRPGDHIVATQDMYGLTRVLLTGHIADFGVRTTFVDMTDLAAVEAALTDGAKVVYLETISNPLVKVLDLKALVQLAKRYGATTIVDNTFASPYLLRPIEFGADLVVHSATKYIGGHGDVTGGTVAAADEAVGKKVRYQAKLLGAVLGPNEAWLAHRGLKTLSLRMARQCDNALAVAEWLAAQPGVERVYYPGLPEHPQHALAKELLGGRFGAMLAFDLRDGERTRVGRFMDALQLVAPAPTLGDLRTLTLYPVVASHRGLTPEERRAVGIGDGLVRLSVGIEEPTDLFADLARGLAAAAATPVPSVTG